MLTNPAASLELVTEEVDIRRARRELTEGELQSLFTATRKSKRTFRGLSGVDRFHTYLTAATNGFRASAIASLVKSDFRLDDEDPTIRLLAKNNKSRKPS